MNLESRIITDLKPNANPKRAEHDRGYLNSQFPTTGAPMPAIRKVTKQLVEDLSSEHSHTQIRTLVHQTWKSTQAHDVMTVCLLSFSSRKPQNTLSDWRLLKSWAPKIDNWAHSDMLSDVYADLLDRLCNNHPQPLLEKEGSRWQELYETFLAWNDHPHPWKRRLSLTSLLYYSAMRKKPLPANNILPLVKKRLGDDHFYVQRAVGWTLRECGNLYPNPTEAFIKKHLLDLSSIAFSTATEKWDKQYKKALVQKRKRERRR